MNNNECLHPATICSKMTLNDHKGTSVCEIVKQCIICKKILERQILQKNPIKEGGIDMKYTLQEKLSDILKANRTEEFEEVLVELRDLGYEIIQSIDKTVIFISDDNFIDIANLNKILN